MRRALNYVLPFCFLVGFGLLAVFTFASMLKNAEDLLKETEWVATCLIGTAAVAGVLIAIHNHVEPLLSEGIWSKHRPVKGRLSNVPIDDMIRAERQFILYSYTKSLTVLLTVLMYDNQLSEDDICRNLSPLTEFRGSNGWWHSLTNPQKRQQVKQRENIVKSIISSIENAVKSHNIKNGMPLQYDSANHAQEPNERTRDVVRTVIRMHTDGQSKEDIVQALDVSIAQRQGKRNLKPA
jgi:hypothetical protein